jgi:hypothetical protein
MNASPATSMPAFKPDPQLESSLLALSRNLDAGTLRYLSGFLASRQSAIEPPATTTPAPSQSRTPPALRGQPYSTRARPATAGASPKNCIASLNRKA